MKFYKSIFILIIAIGCKPSENAIPKYAPVDLLIHNEIVKMDSIFFNAYNTCDLKTQDELYSENLEFYHDKGGLMTSKKDILEGTKNNICGKVTRILIPNSIEVYPIKDYGAIEIGYHRFYNNQEPDAVSKPSKFIVVWKKENTTWKITKVISLH